MCNLTFFCYASTSHRSGLSDKRLMTYPSCHRQSVFPADDQNFKKKKGDTASQNPRQMELRVTIALLLLCCVHCVKVDLLGAGSSFPSPVMPAQFNAWKSSSVYINLYNGSSLTYNVPNKDDSDFAISQLATKAINFIATDIPLNATSLNTLKSATGNRYTSLLFVPHLHVYLSK